MFDPDAIRIEEIWQLDRDCAALLDKIKPLLAGKSPQLQGIVIAELAAIWLAGHLVDSDEAGTKALRAELFSMLTETIQGMLPIKAALIGT